MPGLNFHPARKTYPVGVYLPDWGSICINRIYVEIQSTWVSSYVDLLDHPFCPESELPIGYFTNGVGDQLQVFSSFKMTS
jgi:hypothetical protein